VSYDALNNCAVLVLRA